MRCIYLPRPWYFPNQLWIIVSWILKVNHHWNWNQIQCFSSTNMHWKMPSAQWQLIISWRAYDDVIIRRDRMMRILTNADRYWGMLVRLNICCKIIYQKQNSLALGYQIFLVKLWFCHYFTWCLSSILHILTNSTTIHELQCVVIKFTFLQVQYYKVHNTYKNWWYQGGWTRYWEIMF